MAAVYWGGAGPGAWVVTMTGLVKVWVSVLAELSTVVLTGAAGAGAGAELMGAAGAGAGAAAWVDTTAAGAAGALGVMVTVWPEV